jgi:hypothetical protein
MRIVVDTVTKYIYEMQSHATPGTLIQNCINGGIDPTNLVEMEVDQLTYETMQLENPIWIASCAARDANQLRIEKKRNDIAAALPSWRVYRGEYIALIDAIQAADTLAKLRVATVDLAQRIKKDAKVLYWVAKDTDD